jgi:hypothetical protein
MVTLGPPKYNIGSQIGQALGLGLNQGLSSASQKYQQDLATRQRATQLQQFLNSPGAQSIPPAQKALLSAVSQGIIPESSLKTLTQEDRIRQEDELLRSLLGGQQAANPSEAQEQANANPLSQISEDKLALLVGRGGKIGQLGKFELDRRTAASAAAQKSFESKRDFEYKEAAPLLKEAYELGKNLPLEQANIDLIRSSVKEGNIGGLDQDYLAEIFNFEPLRTAKGTQLKSAGKDLFVKAIQGAGNRPNQWIEQQIGSAMTQIGKTPAANLTIAEMAQFQKDLKQKRADLINSLSEKDEKELGYVRGNHNRREIDKQMKEYAAERQKKLAYDLRVIYEQELGMKDLQKLKKVPPGTPLTPKMASIFLEMNKGDEGKALHMAKKFGFEVMPDEFYDSVAK